jgi:hypothetical protein
MMTPPSVSLILQRDQICALIIRGVLALWFLWGGFWLVNYFGNETTQAIVNYGAPRVFIAALFVTIAGMPFTLGRALMIRSVFQHGQTVKGNATNVTVRQGIHQVWYRYSYEEQSLMGRNLIRQNRSFEGVREQQTVQVCVRKNRPGRSFLWDLYR